jgi:hypothetical protein
MRQIREAMRFGNLQNFAAGVRAQYLAGPH